MCCNYCYHFKECEKTKKTKSSCCKSCAEFEFCPLIVKGTANHNDDTFSENSEIAEVAENESEVDIFDDEEL